MVQMNAGAAVIAATGRPVIEIATAAVGGSISQWRRGARYRRWNYPDALTRIFSSRLHDAQRSRKGTDSVWYRLRHRAGA